MQATRLKQQRELGHAPLQSVIAEQANCHTRVGELPHDILCQTPCRCHSEGERGGPVPEREAGTCTMGAGERGTCHEGLGRGLNQTSRACSVGVHLLWSCEVREHLAASET